MSKAEIILVMIVAVPVFTFVGFTHWWLRAFPTPPLMPVFNYAPRVKSRYFDRSDFLNVSYLSASATSSVCPSNWNPNR